MTEPESARPEPGQQRAVLVGRDDDVVTVTLNRPDAANAFDGRLLEHLHDAVESIRQDDSIRAVIVTGAGRHFSGGADLREKRKERAESRARFGRAIDLSRIRQPVIAAINGAAMGGGCELALTCDFRVISREAQIGLTEIRFGALPLGGGTARLPRLVGLAAAKRMIMLGDPVDAPTAERIGLVDEVAPPGEVLARARDLAARLLTRPDYALRAAKTILGSALDSDLETALQTERQVVKTMATREQRIAARRRAKAEQPTYAQIFGARHDG